VDSTFIPQQDHRSINESIDLSYIIATESASLLRSYLQFKTGNMKEFFSSFYTAFNFLFSSTYQMSEMLHCNGLSNNILKWRDAQGLDEMRCRHGLILFEKYSAELFKCGLLSLRK
jgi:hypothetical protein